MLRETVCPPPLWLRVTGPGHGFVNAAPCVVQLNVIRTAEPYQPYRLLGCALYWCAAMTGSARAVVSAVDIVKSVSPA